ncbi:NAD(P)-binding domain-containing protein [Marimonas lutisalis]|uniref:NAD(P)-binding domain-containing protein n=1 Tax=Marimonas lutisalis TaxID=2545756 RepID=UPI0010F8CB9D|nr:NAD(P)-binding domain-containing protein [Marimonas lutisalis]
MRIGVIGTGAIAAAVVEGIAGDGHDIIVSERSRDVSARLADTFANVRVGTNAAVIEDSDVVFVALMAEVAEEVLRQLPFRRGQRVVSFMAGVSRQSLADMVAPARAEAVVIPFPAIAHGGSPVLCCPGSALVETVFGVANEVIVLEQEADLAAFMAVQAMLSPVVKMLAEGAEWTAARTGDRAGAERFLRLLIGGGLMAEPIGSEGVLDGMLAALNTPGGLNAELREHLGEAGCYEALRAGLDRLVRRLGEV